MADFITKVQVNKPVEQTFQAFLDESLMQHWISGFEEIELLRGAAKQPDSLYRMHIQYDGECLEIYQKLLEINPHERIRVQMEHPEFITHSEILFLPTGTATLMKIFVDLESKSFRVKLAFPLVKSILQHRNRQDYATFKKVAEKRAA